MAENWAIVVGINEYENLSSLKYAQQDAEEIAAWFEKGSALTPVPETAHLNDLGDVV